jgi:LmbE family N-acetylglucosaminyl deacetylase
VGVLALLVCATASVAVCSGDPLPPAEEIIWFENDHQPRQGLVEAIHLLRQAKKNARVLHVGAHPDDENSPLVAYLARGCGFQTAYLSATRGEGGQNAIGPETGPAIGILRTEELLAARVVDGAEQYFLGLPDFGFSKTAEESLAVWNADPALMGDIKVKNKETGRWEKFRKDWDRDHALRRLVRFIRYYKPDLIISCFLGEPVDGHGHHQAIGQLTRRAFHLAADPEFKTEYSGLAWDATDEKYDVPWQANALLASRWRADPDADFELDTGQFDPLYGRSYLQIAAEGRSLHRSQEMGTRQPWGPYNVPMRVLALDDGVTTQGVIESLQLHAIHTSEAFIVRNPDAELEALLKERHAERAASDSTLLKRAMQALYGPQLKLLSPQLEWPILPDCRPAEGIWPTLTLQIRGGSKIFTLREIQGFEAYGNQIEIDVTNTDGSDLLLPVVVNANEFLKFKVRINPVEKFPLTTPELAMQTVLNGYPHINIGSYELNNTRTYETGKILSRHLSHRIENIPTTQTQLIAGPYAKATTGFPPFSLIVKGSYNITDEHAEDSELILGVSPTFATLDKRQGERNVPIRLVPLLSAQITPNIVYSTSNTEEISASVTLRYQSLATTGAVTVEFNNNSYPVELNDNKWREISASFNNIEKNKRPITGKFSYESMQIHEDSSGARRLPMHLHSFPMIDKSIVQYSHIYPHALYQTADLRHLKIDTNIATTGRVGYIPGPGDELHDTLQLLGMDVHEVLPEGVSAIDWSQFDTVITGVRAYEFHPELAANNNRLMNWVKAGGVLVVLYNKYPFQQQAVAPYEFLFHRPHDRITDENAPVKILEPESPVLSFPNKIGPKDFDGWVQERSLYEMGIFDETHYTPLLESADPGEEPHRGILLEAKVGKGRWVYCALALHRQVSAGVPGGIRLLVNLASQGAAPTGMGGETNDE